MKSLLVSFFLFTALTFAAYAQSNVKAIIHLKDGKTIEISHFGKLFCESNRYAETYTTLRGKYNDSFTEIRDYKDISKLTLSGFSAAPAASVGNQKGVITVVKKNGVSVPLTDAELVMSCYGPADKYNEIHVQIINPLTEQKTDMTIEIRNIVSVTF